MVPGRARAQESPAGSRERLVPARHAPAHGNRSWSWTAAEAGSPQSEEGDASGEDPGSPSRPCLHELSRRRLEQRSASSRASSQQRPVVGGWGRVRGDEQPPAGEATTAYWGASCPSVREPALPHPSIPQQGAPHRTPHSQHTVSHPRHRQGLRPGCVSDPLKVIRVASSGHSAPRGPASSHLWRQGEGPP